MRTKYSVGKSAQVAKAMEMKIQIRKGYDNDCRTAITWAPEAHRRLGRPRTTWRTTVEKERERAGRRSWSEVSTAAASELVGIVVSIAVNS